MSFDCCDIVGQQYDGANTGRVIKAAAKSGRTNIRSGEERFCCTQLRSNLCVCVSTKDSHGRPQTRGILKSWNHKFHTTMLLIVLVCCLMESVTGFGVGSAIAPTRRCSTTGSTRSELAWANIGVAVPRSRHRREENRCRKAGTTVVRMSELEEIADEDEEYLEEADGRNETNNFMNADEESYDLEEEEEEEDDVPSDFGEEDLSSAGIVIDDLNWRVEKMRLEEANTRRFLKAKPRFLPYDDAQKWVQAWGTRWRSAKDWNEWIAMGEKRNSYIPSKPDEYYGRLGQWISWAHFLGVPESEEAE